MTASASQQSSQDVQPQKQLEAVETASQKSQDNDQNQTEAIATVENGTVENKPVKDEIGESETSTNQTIQNKASEQPSPESTPTGGSNLIIDSTTKTDNDKTNVDVTSTEISNPELSNPELSNPELSNPENADNAETATPAYQQSDSLSSASVYVDQWRFLHQYTASYDIISDGDRLGRASRTLKKDENGWKLEISTKLKKWLLTLRSNEFSRFRIVNNQLKTDEFYTSTKVSFKDPRIIKQHFDWEKQLEQGSKNKRKWELPLEELLYDRMSHFVKLRADLLSNYKDFKYTVSYKGSRKLYEYVSSGNEVLKTPMGNIDTIRFDRVSGDDSSFSIWLSPDYNYFPIKIAQIEQDKPDVTLALTKLEFVQTPAASE